MLSCGWRNGWHTLLVAIVALVDTGRAITGHVAFLVAAATFAFELTWLGAVGLGLVEGVSAVIIMRDQEVSAYMTFSALLCVSNVRSRRIRIWRETYAVKTSVTSLARFGTIASEMALWMKSTERPS
jgi:hypothetical protein